MGDSGEGEELELKMTSDPSEWRSVHCVSIASDANSGNRRTMEDAHLSIDNFGGLNSQGLFTVFDGHGGRQIVKFLEENFAQELEKHLEPIKVNSKTEKEVIEAVCSTFEALDVESKNIDVSGSTVACCLVRPSGTKSNASKTLYVANVGDTRVILASSEGKSGSLKAERLTYDHTASDPLEIKRIEKAGGFILRKRILGILSVARAIGDHTMKKYIISKPYTSIVKLAKNHMFMIIACDGVWDVLQDYEAVDFVANGIKKGTFTMNEAATQLVAKAKEEASADNITALVIFFQEMTADEKK